MAVEGLKFAGTNLNGKPLKLAGKLTIRFTRSQFLDQASTRITPGNYDRCPTIFDETELISHLAERKQALSLTILKSLQNSARVQFLTFLPVKKAEIFEYGLRL